MEIRVEVLIMDTVNVVIQQLPDYYSLKRTVVYPVVNMNYRAKIPKLN